MSRLQSVIAVLVVGVVALAASPARADLQADIDQVVKILEDIPDDWIPGPVVKEAHGFAVINVVKFAGGIGASGGRGIVVARTKNGWSPPSGLGTGSMSLGIQFGLDVTELVFLLDTPEAVKALTEGNGLAGLDARASFFPWGRAVTASSVPKASIYGNGNSAGLFAGISFKGGFVSVLDKENERFYGKPVSAMSILRGEVETPPGARRLLELLNKY